MPRHLQTPNLPETAVCHMLVAEFACPLLSVALSAHGVQALPAPKTMSLPYRVNDHADMNCRHLGGKELMVFRDAILHPDMNAAGLKILRSAVGGGEKYPADAALNALLLSGFAFHKNDITDPALQNELAQRGYEPVHVNQGYTACSVAIVDENSIITADERIAAEAADIGLDVLLVSPGHICLPGYDYGFIGGACGKIAPDKLAFTGTLKHHPDYARILAFLAERGVEAVFLTDEPCFDCGGLIPVTQL